MSNLRSVFELLRDHGISLRSISSGRYYTTCPQCSHKRKKPHQKLKCLGVTIRSRGLVFGCYHCGWKGGAYCESARFHRPGKFQAPVPDDDAAKRSAFALRLWNEARDPRGTIVAEYLASRRLTLPDDVANNAIRFHPALYFDGARVGGMVSLFRDIRTNEPRGIHRTFLDGAGRKLDRMMLGRVQGAAIKLDADEIVTLGLHVGEGLETCLTAWLAGFRPVWALGSAIPIAAFPVLSGIEAITVLGEVGDGGANHQAAQACAARWIDAGREALIVVPQIGGDLNDVWQEAVP